MKKTLFALMAVALLATAHAQSINIQNSPLGSGDPSLSGVGTSQAASVNGAAFYHVPQFMPGFPTAATIYPRVVDVKCQAPVGTNTGNCDGYNWSPDLGRGEYLFVRQAEVLQPLTRDVVVLVPGQVQERIIYKEVPVKKMRQ